MKCPRCQTQSKVLDTRGHERRRECEDGHRFWTKELVVREVVRAERDYKRDYKPLREKARELFASGSVPKRVAGLLGVSLATVYTWKRKSEDA
jgi:transcriptional regulator NrdR family protein